MSTYNFLILIQQRANDILRGIVVTDFNDRETVSGNFPGVRPLTFSEKQTTLGTIFTVRFVLK